MEYKVGKAVASEIPTSKNVQNASKWGIILL